MSSSVQLTLAIDASTYAGSVALLRGYEIISERVLPDSSEPMRGSRGEGMMPAIAECLREASLKPGDLQRIVCGEGPGSFTSLRIAASLAKGLAHSIGVPLYAVSSLLLLAAGRTGDVEGVVAAINAMRGDVFAAEFRAAGKSLQLVGEPVIVAESELAKFAGDRNALLVRAGIGGANPVASRAATVLDSVIFAGPVDLGLWEPTYGRLAEAQVRWEKASGHPLPT